MKWTHPHDVGEATPRPTTVKPGVRWLVLGVAATLLLASQASPAAAQALWRGAGTGDSLPQLRLRFPQAAAPAAPDTLSGGEVEALRLPLTSLAGAPAVASFFLRDGALANVQLRVGALPEGRSAENLAFARAVANEIGRTAGPGYDCGATRIAAITQFGCKWLQGGVVVREYYLDVAGRAPIFAVAYRRADDPGFDL